MWYEYKIHHDGHVTTGVLRDETLTTAMDAVTDVIQYTMTSLNIDKVEVYEIDEPFLTPAGVVVK